MSKVHSLKSDRSITYSFWTVYFYPGWKKAEGESIYKKGRSMILVKWWIREKRGFHLMKELYINIYLPKRLVGKWKFHFAFSLTSYDLVFLFWFSWVDWRVVSFVDQSSIKYIIEIYTDELACHPYNIWQDYDFTSKNGLPSLHKLLNHKFIKFSINS